MSEGVPTHPIWWTTLPAEAFKGTKAPMRSKLLKCCHKSQTWFPARLKLEGHPKRLSYVAGEHYAKCVEKLERE